MINDMLVSTDKCCWGGQIGWGGHNALKQFAWSAVVEIYDRLRLKHSPIFNWGITDLTPIYW